MVSWLRKENQLSKCRQAGGGVSILDSLLRACGSPPDQVSAALNVERLRSTNIFSRWIEGIGESLRDGQDRGLVRKDLKPEDGATFLVATYEGYISLAKGPEINERATGSGNGFDCAVCGIELGPRANFSGM